LATDADEPAKRRNRKLGGKKMEKTEKEEIGKTEKTTIVQAFLHGCGTGLERLKYEVAKMSIDMTGTMEQEYKVLLRVVRGYDPILGYYKDGDDGYTNNQRFWFGFPMFFYRDMPSGRDIEEDEEEYRVTDTEGRIAKIDKDDLIGWLIYDLTEYNYGNFNDTWEEFVEHLYAWIIEPDEGATPSMTNKPT
jgi:hypothetical protein